MGSFPQRPPPPPPLERLRMPPFARPAARNPAASLWDRFGGMMAFACEAEQGKREVLPSPAVPDLLLSPVLLPPLLDPLRLPPSRLQHHLQHFQVLNPSVFLCGGILLLWWIPTQGCTHQVGLPIFCSQTLVQKIFI